MRAKKVLSMCDELKNSIRDCFADLPDPRVTGRCDHKLIDIIIIAICGVISGADSWVGIETYGKAKEAWLSAYLSLDHGIPSHDTFGDVFSQLDSEAFQAGFSRWIETVFSLTTGQVVAIDGKTARRSHDRNIGKDAIHIVSAWASENGIVLGQRKVDDKSNEITAIPELLRLLDVRDCVVTIDAIGCQTAIARTIREEKADYILRVKDNQLKLRQDIEDWFVYGDQIQFEGMNMDYVEQVSKTSGRVEIRRCWAITDPIAMEHIRHYEGWTDLQSIIRIERETHLSNKMTRDIAYYISSLANDARRILLATRHHWAIENSLHWVLDVTFHEDDSRIRQGDSPQNMALLRHIALNILKQDQTKSSLKQKRFRAGLDDSFMLKLLSQI
jgi:predicted transposase YbfD/YdcC